MQGEAFLLTVAQIGLALAGITSIIALLRHTGQEWLPQDILGMRTVLELSFATVFFALLPFPLQHTFIHENTVWKIASLILLLFFLSYISIFMYRVSMMKKGGAPPRRPIAIIVSAVITFFFVMIQLFNLLRWNSVASYTWGLLWLLIAPAQQLFFFISYFEIQHNKSRGADD